MGLSYRWMKKKDLQQLPKDRDFEFLLKNNRTVANVVEQNDSILGYIVYKIFQDRIKIIKIKFSTVEVLDIILSKLKSKSKLLVIKVPDYDLEMQLLLKNKNFLATQIARDYELEHDFYIFEL